MKKLKPSDILEGMGKTECRNAVMYPLHEVLFIMLAAVLCGAESYRKIEFFAKYYKEWLSGYLNLSNGIPDAFTYRRVMRMIAPEQMQTLYENWEKPVIASRTAVSPADRKPMPPVRAYVHESGIVLGRILCEAEEDGMPDLLDMLDISDCLVTVEAAGAQTELVRKLREKQAEYLLDVNPDQTALFRDIRRFMEDHSRDSDAVSSAYVMRKRNGVLEKRECFVCESLDWLTERRSWTDLNGVGMIAVTSGVFAGTAVQKQYFLYSCANWTAGELMQAHRIHWRIGDKLQWVQDIFPNGEAQAESADAFNALRRTAHSILKKDTIYKESVLTKQTRCLASTKYLDAIVRDWLCSGGTAP